EDGIRDRNVTGVQTCALPILGDRFPKVATVHDVMPVRFPALFRPWHRNYAAVVMPRLARAARAVITGSETAKQEIVEWLRVPARSEERRVGKECRCRWWPRHI